MRNNNIDERFGTECSSFSRNIGQKIMFFMIGGSIGAALALLLAPKSGKDLRADIAGVAEKGYDETLAAADRLKLRTVEYYKVAKETGNEVLDVVAAGASAVRAEVSEDVEKIGAIVSESARRAPASARH
jgi:gas vesicle protein